MTAMTHVGQVLGCLASSLAIGMALYPTRAVAQDPKGSIDVCTFIDKAKIDAIMGGAPSEAKPKSSYKDLMGVHNHDCRYRGPSTNRWTVQVQLERGRSKEDLAGYLKNLRGVVQQTTATAATRVPGLGDEAWWGAINPANGILTVIKGTDVLWVQVYQRGATSGIPEKAKAVAELAFAGYTKAT